jgi:predicted amidohydrolase
MLSVTVNAARPVARPDPGLPAEGGSTIWQDFGHGSFREEGGFAPHSAVRIAEAGSGEEIIYGDWDLPTTNKQRSWMLNSIPRWRAWFAAGAQSIYSETDR